MKKLNRITKLTSLYLITLSLIFSFTTHSSGQASKRDTVIVELASTSRLIFTIKDRADLPTLKAYDYQALFKDILSKIEGKDSISSGIFSPDTTTSTQPVVVENWTSLDNDEEDEDDDWDDDWDNDRDDRYRHDNRQGFFNFDLGMNNYLADGKFPDEATANYAVRPWGSWYVGLNSIQKLRVAGKFFTELGLGVSWYNFKFEDDGLILTKGANGVEFTQSPPDINPEKSKLTVCYLNASLIPVFDFGSRPHKSLLWGHGDGFRVGLGPYIGYRIDSYSKQVYYINGDKEKDHERSSYYLNNLRYGARFQIGYRGTDLFVNYDMNDLYVENRGPKLNALSFGVIF
jgi:hypothetical protein